MKEYTEIPTYEQCLQIVKDEPAFSHSTQYTETGDVIESFKYKLNKPNMWEGRGRLNMRGITFVNKRLASLPWPKFFNRGEHHSTPMDLDMSEIKYMFNKIDGSLISFFYLSDKKIELKSMKSVNSDVAVNARMVVTDSMKEFVRDLLDRNISPMFEYTSEENRIVLEYDQGFHFLGGRDMTTGKLLFPIVDINIPNDMDFKVPNMFNTVEQLENHMKRDDVEGVVCTLNNGLMFKLKTQKYCKLHRIISDFSKKNIVNSIMDDEFDDVISTMREHNCTVEASEALKIYNEFFLVYNDIYNKCKDFVNSCNGMSRKESASKVFQSEIKTYQKIVFLMLDDKVVEESLKELVKNILLEKN